MVIRERQVVGRVLNKFIEYFFNLLFFLIYFFSFLPNFKLKLGKKQKNIFFFFPNLKLGKIEKKTLKLGKKNKRVIQ